MKIESKNKFIFSYSLHDKIEDKFTSYRSWNNPRKKNFNRDLLIDAIINPIEKKLTVRASKFSKVAKEQIEKLGGKAEVI